MKKVLHNQKGETLIETLAAILIFTMASIALYSMVMTAAKLNHSARTTETRVQDQLVFAERADTPVKAAQIHMKINVVNGGPVELPPVDVQVFQEGSSDSLYSYFKAP